MLKRVLAASVVFVATAALAADQQAITQELAWGRDLASIIESVLAGIATAAGILLAIRSWWRRRRRKQEAARAAAQKIARAEEENRIDQRVAAAITTFRRSVLEPEFDAHRNAMRAALQTHAADAQAAIDAHAEQTQAQIDKVSIAVGHMASRMEEIGNRIERSVSGCHDRIDDFLRCMATGQLPHFRALPRPDAEEEAAASR